MRTPPSPCWLSTATTPASDAAAVPDSELIGTEVLAGFQFDDDNETRKVAYKGVKRYVRLTVTPANNASAALLSAVAILGHPDLSPTPTRRSDELTSAFPLPPCHTGVVGAGWRHTTPEPDPCPPLPSKIPGLLRAAWPGSPQFRRPCPQGVPDQRTAPASTAAALADITQIGAGGGYSAGGYSLSGVTWSERLAPRNWSSLTRSSRPAGIDRAVSVRGDVQLIRDQPTRRADRLPRLRQRIDAGRRRA